MILTEKYRTEGGVLVFESEGSDMEFVAVELNKLLWYLGVVNELDQMGINPERVKPAEPNEL